MMSSRVVATDGSSTVKLYGIAFIISPNAEIKQKAA